MNSRNNETVNGKSPPDPQRGIGDNNPPPTLTAKVKLARIEAIIERGDLTAAQKCIGVGIVVKANRDGVAEAKTQELMNFASVRDRETVFRATKILHELEVLEKANKPGQTGRYNVLPPKVIDAIVAAHEAYLTGRVKPDGMGDETDQAKPDGVGGDHAVRSEPTSPAKPVGSNPTALAQDAPAYANGHARIEPPSGVNISQEASKLASGLAGLNGSAEPMIADVVSWMVGGTLQAGRQWLSTFLQQFSQEVVRNSYMKLKTDIAEGSIISKPLQTWTKIAQRMKADPPARDGPAGPPKETRLDRMRRYVEEAQSKKEQRRS